MNDIPPKNIPPNAPPFPPPPPEQGGGFVALYNAASQSGMEQFPVLKAFQDYIETERAQARKRVVQLSITFAAVLVLVIA